MRAGVGEIRLNRPEQLNALTLEMIEAIDRQLAEWAADPKVTGLVGASAGGLLSGLVLLVRPRRREEENALQASVPGPAVAADVHGQL